MWVQPSELGEEQRWGPHRGQIRKSLEGQCEDLGLEGGEEPLEDSARRRDINGLEIFQHVSGCAVNTDYSGARAEGGGHGNHGGVAGLWMCVF